MSKDADYYADNADEFNALSDDDRQKVLAGDILADPEPVIEQAADDAPIDENPVVLAKDGKHTIPFSEFNEYRTKVEQLTALTQQQAEFIQSLQQAKVDDAKTGGTAATDAVIAEYQGDFPEIAEDIKPYIQALISDGIRNGLAEIGKTIDSRVAPVEKALGETAAEKHFNAINSAHPDIDEILESDGFKQWQEAQPSFMRASIMSVLNQGTAQQVIELFDTYKDASAKPEPAETLDLGKAKEAISKAKAKVPGTLTDIPTGIGGTIDEAEALTQMSDAQIDNLFRGKTPAQIDSLLMKVLK
jgi:hypothetical protein